jgi:predicted nucleic acid-binding Zn ribbon protein
VRFGSLRLIEDEVRRELARFGPAAGLGEVVEVWPECVGGAIATNAWPARVARDGTLHVATSSSAWAFELTQLAGSIQDRLADRLGELAPASLRFAPGPLPERGAPSVESSARIVRKVSEVDLEKGAWIAQGIEDPDLRDAVARAAAASLAAGSNRPI